MARRSTMPNSLTDIDSGLPDGFRLDTSAGLGVSATGLQHP
jgi:hypothetical protein